MRNILLTLVALLSATITFAQSNAALTGRVIDATTGRAIDFADVVVTDTENNTVASTTVRDGAFLIERVREGEFIVTVMLVGYQPYVSAPVRFQPGKSVDLGTLQLSMTETGLEEIVVEGQRSQIVYKLDRQRISGSGALEQAEGYFKQLGKKALIVTDAVMIKLGNLDQVTKVLDKAEVAYSVYDGIGGEPTDVMIEKGLELYEEAGLKVIGLYMEEKELPKYIELIIEKTTPDIVVITGHDIYDGKDKTLISSYENSETFGKSIRKIRKHFSDTVIIAGACGSHYEYLIGQGANFASSPARINIHTFDPAVTAIKVASTPVNRMVDYLSIIKYIDGGKDAIGGIETYGKMKII